MRIRRALVVALFALILLAAWSAGLVIFVDYIPREPAVDTTPTDAIVVLTGGSERLGEGVRLLTAGLGRKLLVSGVHSDVKLQELVASLPAEVIPPDPEQLACCIVPAIPPATPWAMPRKPRAGWNRRACSRCGW
jgi:hypothetical protein